MRAEYRKLDRALRCASLRVRGKKSTGNDSPMVGPGGRDRRTNIKAAAGIVAAAATRRVAAFSEFYALEYSSATAVQLISRPLSSIAAAAAAAAASRGIENSRSTFKITDKTRIINNA